MNVGSSLYLGTVLMSKCWRLECRRTKLEIGYFFQSVYLQDVQSTLHKSMPHKWIFIQVDFFGQACPLPIASNRGQRLTRFLHKSIFDCPAPHKEINVFVHSSQFCNNSMWSVCVVSTWLCAHTLYTPLYLLN